MFIRYNKQYRHIINTTLPKHIRNSLRFIYSKFLNNINKNAQGKIKSAVIEKRGEKAINSAKMRFCLKVCILKFISKERIKTIISTNISVEYCLNEQEYSIASGFIPNKNMPQRTVNLFPNILYNKYPKAGIATVPDTKGTVLSRISEK